MPRLLPRLLKVLQETNSSAKYIPRLQNVGSRKRKSLYRPIPVFLPSFHPDGRTRSILLDENPVTDKSVFARHKRLPPRVCLGPRPVTHDEYDVPREMTSQEREWWSSPYLRMLATPLRECRISKRFLPNDFLVRLAVLRLPPTTENARSVEVFMPDGLEHPKYKRRKARVAVYVPCWKSAVETMKSPVTSSYNGRIYFSKHLFAHISYLLRLRVLQELEVLIDALKQNRRRIEFNADVDPTILRRLTRYEFRTLRETERIPYPDAVAVLVVPPVNRDPRTKVRPQPSREPEIPSSEPPSPVHKKALAPLSSLFHARDSGSTLGQPADHSSEAPLSSFLPNPRVPLYNGIAMFPSPPHRAALHKQLTELLDVERHFRQTRSETRTVRKEGTGRAKGDAKGSHAFLLVSNEQTVKRADTAALAIALWRVRMWEGDAFAAHKVQGWEIGKDWRVEQSV